MNTYLLKLLNQYREKLGITDLNSTAAMLAAAIERGTTLTTGQMEHNLIYINQAATDNNVGSLAECLGGLNTAMQGNNKTLSMLELMNSAASSLNDMLNSDGGSDWGHRNIFLSDGSTSGFVSGNGAFSLEYNTTLGSWIMNFNADTGSTGTSVVNDTPAATSLPSAGNNSAYEAAKAQSDKTLSNLAATQTTAYNKAVSDSQTALASLKSSQDDVVTNLVFSNSSKLMSYVNGLTSKLNTLKTTLQAQVDALNLVQSQLILAMITVQHHQVLVVQQVVMDRLQQVQLDQVHLMQVVIILLQQVVQDHLLHQLEVIIVQLLHQLVVHLQVLVAIIAVQQVLLEVTILMQQVQQAMIALHLHQQQVLQIVLDQLLHKRVLLQVQLLQQVTLHKTARQTTLSQQ